MSWEPVIGLEVHAQLATRTKLFCGCSTAFGAPPNTHVCPVCLGLPGALPVPNERAIELALRAGRALGCEIRERSVFARKSYFYPDLAKGYQISQFDRPVIVGGVVPMDVGEGVLTRIHLEEDAAKNLHDASGLTRVDFNRAGVPLIEIVGEPTLTSGDEAEAYLRSLREILLFIGVNDGNLEEGSFRCDANVSIRERGAPLGTRVELKNINSFRFVRKAIEFEIARQKVVVEEGGAVVQETRTWNEDAGRTISMRGKEEAHDYRYFPDPDLPPLRIDPGLRARVEALELRLPRAIRARWVALGLSEEDAHTLSQHPRFTELFDALVARVGDAEAKRAASFVRAEVLKHATTEGMRATWPVEVDALAELLQLVIDQTINGKIAKGVFATMLETGLGPNAIVEKEGLAQVTDTGAIEAAVRKVIADNPKQAEQYRSGKTAVLGFFVGQVMQATRGQANPQLVQELLRKLL